MVDFLSDIMSGFLYLLKIFVFIELIFYNIVKDGHKYLKWTLVNTEGAVQKIWYLEVRMNTPDWN